MRALIIDDSKPVRSILAKMFRALDFETFEASNGREALDQLDTMDPPDVATVNWQMPVMDGLQFIRAIRASARLRSLPLLMISSEADPDQVSRALAAGANDYIVKPCTPRSLGERLKRLGIDVPAILDMAVVGSPRDESPGAPDTPDTGAKPDKGSLKSPNASHPVSPPATGGPVRVMIVDDSAVVRRMLQKWLSDDPELEVVGTAVDGRAALDALDRLRPDVILLDIEMPNLDGLETLKILRRTHGRLPVIMFSSLTERGAKVTLDALFLGANDYVPKPGGAEMSDPAAARRVVNEQLLPKIKQFRRRHPDLTGHGTPGPTRLATPTSRPAKCVELLAIAASTGGPAALGKLLSDLPRPYPVPIVIVQHMPPLFTHYLADRLSTDLGADVREARDEERIGAGQVRIAMGGRHLAVTRESNATGLRLNDGPPVNCCRPSADVLFESAAAAYGGRVLAVVLTGMGQDGLEGCRRIRSAGGQIVVQDEATSVVWGMPGKVANAGLASAILPLEELGREIGRRLRARGN